MVSAMAPWESGTAKTAALQAKMVQARRMRVRSSEGLPAPHDGAAHKDGAGAGEHAAKGSKIGHTPKAAGSPRKAASR